MLPVAVARSSSDGNAIRCVLPDMWITSCFHISEQMARIKDDAYCFVQFARRRHRRRGLPSPSASCLTRPTCNFISQRDEQMTRKLRFSRPSFKKMSLTFLPRDAMLARYMLLSCVRVSVRPSHAGIVPKRLNISLREQRHTIAQRP